MSTSEPIDLARRLIQFDTINPPGREAECIAFLADFLKARGFATQIQSFGEGRSNLIATLGDRTKPGGLCFSGHVDTVPLGQEPWTQDPFGGRVVGDRLYGRGATDMKAGIAAFIVAALAFNTRDWSRTGPLTLILTGGEETGCEGAAAIASAHLCGPHDLLMIAEPTSNLPVIGHKGVAWYKAVMKGKTAHGSMPEEGVNAALRGAEFVRQLQQVETGSPHDALGRGTINVGTFHSGLNINSVPDRAEICIDCRVVPGMSEPQLRDQIAHGLKDDDELDVLLNLDPVWSDPDGARVKTIVNICRRHMGEQVQWAVAPYFTDAAILQPAMKMPPTVILGPGHAEIAHKVDEWCSIARIGDAVKIYSDVLEHWLQA